MPRCVRPRSLSALLILVATAAAAPAAVAAAGLPAEQERIALRMTKADCRNLVKHLPAPDVAYRPGVDVRGRPVGPADLPGTPSLVLSEEIAIFVEVDLFQRLGIPADPGLFQGTALVGTVTYADGRTYLDGQPLQDEAAAELAVLCREALTEAP